MISQRSKSDLRCIKFQRNLNKKGKCREKIKGLGCVQDLSTQAGNREPIHIDKVLTVLCERSKTPAKENKTDFLKQLPSF